MEVQIFWCARQDLNLRLPDPQSGVLSRLNYGRTVMRERSSESVTRESLEGCLPRRSPKDEAGNYGRTIMDEMLPVRKSRQSVAVEGGVF